MVDVSLYSIEWPASKFSFFIFFFFLAKEESVWKGLQTMPKGRACDRFISNDTGQCRVFRVVD